MIYLVLISSSLINCIVPIPSTIVLPTIPFTPMCAEDLDMDMSNSSCEKIWCVAQLSVLNLVELDSNDHLYISSLSTTVFVSAMKSEISQVSDTRYNAVVCL